MNRYSYEGPVLVFNRCVQDNWKGETFAESEAKARSNLAYQWKKAHNRERGSKVSLPGKVNLMQ